VKDMGAIVDLPGGKDALVHISELSLEPVESVAAAVKIGDEIDVMIIGLVGNSTRASVAAIERVAKGLPMLEKRTRQRPKAESDAPRGQGGTAGRARDSRGRGDSRGREDSHGRGDRRRNYDRGYQKFDSNGSDYGSSRATSIADSSGTSLSVKSGVEGSSSDST
jgi:predicted RNA-binding protein with RPS1 domain